MLDINHASTETDAAHAEELEVDERAANRDRLAEFGSAWYGYNQAGYRQAEFDVDGSKTFEQHVDGAKLMYGSNFKAAVLVSVEGENPCLIVWHTDYAEA